MVASSETPYADQTASFGLLSIKPNQNLILDFDSSKYNAFLQPLIECLHQSPLTPTLALFENVPLSYLYKAYSIVRYQESGSIMTFEVRSQETSITKAQYSRLMGFPASRDLVDP
ncbi:unnamed protein product [Lactuca saligna]|uniref:Uncharacterized protein n=1 Tax=Lactuca saligna TaxID=75948 RepID=A0AA36A4G3_LACSI|nr:unnamed protein product [Lactuca saligna]